MMLMIRLLGRFGMPLLIGMLLCQLTFAQNKTITGTVNDKNGSPIAGVSVTAKGSNRGTTTDASGKFSLSVSNNTSTIVISSVGYATQEININGQSSISVSMQDQASSLNEIVVVGYGT